MKISSSCKFVIRPAFSYDIKSCDNTVLSQVLNYDTSFLNGVTDKTERVKRIGLFYRNNPNISKKVKSIVQQIIANYQNQIGQENVVCTQYDGFLSSQKLTNPNAEKIPIEFRDTFVPLILSVNRKSYIAWSTKKNKVIVKGVSRKYDELIPVYERLVKTNFTSMQAIFSTLNYLKQQILTKQNVRFFMIPNVNKRKYTIYFKNIGPTEIDESMLNLIDHNEINKLWYWQFYFERFAKSILIEVL